VLDALVIPMMVRIIQLVAKLRPSRTRKIWRVIQRRPAEAKLKKLA